MQNLKISNLSIPYGTIKQDKALTQDIEVKKL